MLQKNDRTYVMLRIPLFILALCLSIPGSQWIAYLAPDNEMLRQLAYPFLIILFVGLFEVTRLSHKRVHALFGIAIVLCALGVEMISEPGDYSWIWEMVL